MGFSFSPLVHAPGFGTWGCWGSKFNFLNMVMWHIKLKGMSSRPGYTENFYPTIKLVNLAWCFGCLSDPLGFTCWISFARYSVLFTVESLSLLYLLVISWFICFRRWCIDKLGVFHANQVSMTSWSTSELRVRLALLNGFKPSSKIFYWPFQGCTSFVDLYVFVLSCVGYVFVHACLYVLWGHLLGKGWPLGSRLWCLLWVCHFPIGIQGRVWYLIVSIPDLCTPTYLGMGSKGQIPLDFFESVGKCDGTPSNVFYSFS